MVNGADPFPLPPESPPLSSSSAFYRTDWYERILQGENLGCGLAIGDFPDDYDFKVWGKDAISFVMASEFHYNIYALNPHDFSCYHIACFNHPCHWQITATCKIVGSELFLFHHNPKDSVKWFLIELWIWDVSEAQKKKRRGETHKWKRGPGLHHRIKMPMVFSLGGDIYVLDLRWNFRLDFGRETFDQSFHCLKLQSGGCNWVTLQNPPYFDNVFDEPCGVSCVGDTGIVFHFTDDLPLKCADSENDDDDDDDDSCRSRLANYFISYDVADNKWTDCVVYTEDKSPRALGFCYPYLAQSEDYSLLLHPHTGKLVAYDFAKVNDPVYGYPQGYEVEVDDRSCWLNDIIKFLEPLPCASIKLFRSLQLGDGRFCILAFGYPFYTRPDYRRDVFMFACTLSLSSKQSGEHQSAKRYRPTSEEPTTFEGPFYAAIDGARVHKFKSDGSPLWIPWM